MRPLKRKGTVKEACFKEAVGMVIGYEQRTFADNELMYASVAS